MIGIKSLIAIVLAASAVAIGISRGAFDGEHFAHLSAGSAFAVGLFASTCAALVGFGWRPRTRSKTALAVRRGYPVLVDEAAHPRELPALVQRLLLVVVFATVALATFGNEATARIGNVPADFAKPSRSEYCQPEQAEPEAAPAPIVTQQPVDQAGCALVKRAFALGYAKSLGSCAPKTVAAAAAKPVAKPREVCTRRQLDEPFLHYAYRKLVETTSDAAPVDALAARAEGVRTRLDYLDDLIADIKHAVTGTPHASHHLWVDLPDPRPGSWRDLFTGKPPCASLFADLPLWPAWDAAASPSNVFEHVFGQLLFATRFGTTASCSDYTIHWDASPDACAKLAADPEGFLADQGALPPVHAVLDRRRRQVAMRELAGRLGQPSTLPVPPDARAVVSVACLMFDAVKPTAATSRDVTIEGEPIAMRELHTSAIRATGAGPLDVYTALALLLGGAPYAGAAAASIEPSGPARDLDDADFPLLRLEPLVDADPFLGARQPLERADVTLVYPIEHHLHAFVDAFRRIYLPQRGRL